MIYLCADHGLIGSDDVREELTGDGRCFLRCGCGKMVKEVSPPMEHEFVCEDCGYRCWDPEVDIGYDGEVEMSCPKCESTNRFIKQALKKIMSEILPDAVGLDDTYNGRDIAYAIDRNIAEKSYMLSIICGWTGRHQLLSDLIPWLGPEDLESYLRSKVKMMLSHVAASLLYEIERHKTLLESVQRSAAL